jgi:hypothetical protein
MLASCGTDRTRLGRRTCVAASHCSGKPCCVSETIQIHTPSRTRTRTTAPDTSYSRQARTMVRTASHRSSSTRSSCHRFRICAAPVLPDFPASTHPSILSTSAIIASPAQCRRAEPHSRSTSWLASHVYVRGRGNELAHFLKTIKKALGRTEGRGAEFMHTECTRHAGQMPSRSPAGDTAAAAAAAVDVTFSAATAAVGRRRCSGAGLTSFRSAPPSPPTVCMSWPRPLRLNISTRTGVTSVKLSQNGRQRDAAAAAPSSCKAGRPSAARPRGRWRCRRTYRVGAAPVGLPQHRRAQRRVASITHAGGAVK